MSAGALGNLVVSLEANIAKFESGMNAALGLTNKTMAGIESAVGTAKVAMGALGVGLTAASFASAIKGAMDLADNMGKMAQKTGLSVESFSKLQYAAGMADVSTEVLGKALKELNKSLSDAAAGSDESIAKFASLGVSFKDAQGNIRSADETLLDFADRFAKMPENADKVNAAIRQFGQKIGPELLPYLNQGRAGIIALGDELERFGGIISAEAAREAERFNDNMRALEQSSKSLYISLGNNLAPQLADITTAMRESAKESGLLYTIWVGMGGVAANLFGNGGNEVRIVRDAIQETKEEIERLESQKERARGSLIFGPASMAQLEEAKKQLAELEAKLGKLTGEDGKKPKSDNSAAAQDAAKWLDRFKSEKQRMQSELDQANAYRKQELISEQQYQLAVASITKKSRDEETKKRYESAKAEQDAEEMFAKDYAEAWEWANKFHTRIHAEEAAARKAQADAEAKGEEMFAKDYAEAWQWVTHYQLKADKDKNDQIQKDWGGTLETLESGFRDSFMRMMEGGKGWWKSFTDGLKNTFKTTVADAIYQMLAKPLALNLVANIANGMGMNGLGQAAINALGQNGQQGNSMVGNILSSVSSATGLSGFTSGIQMGWQSGVAAPGAIGESIGAWASGAYESILSMVGQIPIWGWIAAAVAALAYKFRDKGENWKGQLGFGANANVYATDGVFGREGFTHIAGDDGLNSQIQAFMARTGEMDKILAGILSADQITNVTAALAGYNRRTDGQPAEFAFGRNDETAGQQLTTEYLKVKYGAVFDQIAPQMANLIRGFSGTSEELSKLIGNLVQTQEILHSMTSANALETALKQFEESRDPLTQSMTRNRAALDQMIAAYDGSADSVNAMIQAQSQYYLANVSMIAQLTELKFKIGDMFGQTARGIQLAGLSNEDQYNFLQAESDRLYAAMMESTSVAEIERLAGLLNANFSSAFGLLSPDQQAAQRQQFLDNIGRVSEDTQGLITARQREISEAATKANEEIRDLLTKAADAQQVAGDTQLEAANIFAGAVGTGLDIRVDYRVPTNVEAYG